MLDVEIPRDGGTSAGFADVEVLEDGYLHVVGHTELGVRVPPGSIEAAFAQDDGGR